MTTSSILESVHRARLLASDLWDRTASDRLRRAVAPCFAAMIVALVAEAGTSSLIAAHRQSILDGQRYSLRFKSPYIWRHRELRAARLGDARFESVSYRRARYTRSRAGAFLGTWDTLIDWLLGVLNAIARWTTFVIPAGLVLVGAFDWARSRRH